LSGGRRAIAPNRMICASKIRGIGELRFPVFAGRPFTASARNVYMFVRSFW
jgi:hypothetical protein